MIMALYLLFRHLHLVIHLRALLHINMKRIVSISAVLFIAVAYFALTSSSQENGIGSSGFHKNDITYSMEVVTPHVKWANSLPGGPIKSFFIPPVQYGRDMVEIMQRISLQPTTVTIDRNWDLSFI